MVVTATPPDCGPKSVTIPVKGSMNVYDEVRQGPGDVFAKKYQFGFGGSAVETFACSSGSLTLALVLLVSSDCGDIGAAPSWTDRDHPSGSASLACGTSYHGTVSWSLDKE
jgi:hypothetical protein